MSRLVKFKKEWQGFMPGQTYEVGIGVADAYVNHARVAEFIDKPEIEEETNLATSETVSPSQQRQLNKRRGRPKGSKNKAKK